MALLASHTSTATILLGYFLTGCWMPGSEQNPAMCDATDVSFIINSGAQQKRKTNFTLKSY
jgi:hypothetical protein